MLDHIKKIEELENINQIGKNDQIRFEEQKKINREEKTKVLGELKEAGVTEDNIESISKEKDKLFSEKLEKIEESLK